MTVDDTLHRLEQLSPEAADDLAGSYWTDLNAINPRNRDDNRLEPLLDRYAAEHDVDRGCLGLEAGALGSRLRDRADSYDSVADAVEAYHNTLQALADDAPATAAAAEVLVADVLPAYMDSLGIDGYPV